MPLIKQGVSLSIGHGFRTKVLAMLIDPGPMSTMDNRLRWYQFRLRSLLLLMLVVQMVCIMVCILVRPAETWYAQYQRGQRLKAAFTNWKRTYRGETCP